MSSKELELDFDFSNDELANFLENFAEKIREGEVGLSFKGQEEVDISPNRDNQMELEFDESDEYKKMRLEVTLRQDVDTTDAGREKISVEIV
ncbi:MAG: amphi-Trp domain-containing protein [Candidatus Nanohaloarchaea archaeon]